MNLDVEAIFSYHPPRSDSQRMAHESIRQGMLADAVWFEEVLPDCAEKTLAIRKLQEAMMYANAAIAIHGV